MMRKPVTVLSALVAAGALAVAGCGGEEEPAAPDEGASGEPVATLDVSETEFAIDPPNPTIDESGLIEFAVSNDGQVDHALEIEGPEEVETETIPPGDSATLEAELPPGEYKWYCPIGDHEQQGMVGTVTVGGGGGSAGESESEDESAGGSGSSPY